MMAAMTSWPWPVMGRLASPNVQLGLHERVVASGVQWMRTPLSVKAK
jgi:hypothetical protein